MPYRIVDREPRLQQAQTCFAKCRAGVYFSGIPIFFWGVTFAEERFFETGRITVPPRIDIGYLGYLNRQVNSPRSNLTWDEFDASPEELAEFNRRAVSLVPTRRMQRDLVYVCRVIGALRYSMGIDYWGGQRGLNQLQRLVPKYVPYDLVDTSAEEIKELSKKLRLHGAKKLASRFLRVFPQAVSSAEKLFPLLEEYTDEELGLTYQQRVLIWNLMD